MSVENLMAADSATMKQPNKQAGSSPAVPVIDYEGSGYRQDFWEGQGREYEDAVERIALRRLLPPRGGRIAEIGAGFGRLADLYLGYEQIVLFDYSRTMLSDAVRRWGADERFVFVAGNLYQMPLADQSLDALVMVRVMHHLADVPAALARLQALLHKESTGRTRICQQTQPEGRPALADASAVVVTLRPGAAGVCGDELRFSSRLDGRKTERCRPERASTLRRFPFPAADVEEKFAGAGSRPRGQLAVWCRRQIPARAQRLRTGACAGRAEASADRRVCRAF